MSSDPNNAPIQGNDDHLGAGTPTPSPLPPQFHEGLQHRPALSPTSVEVPNWQVPSSSVESQGIENPPWTIWDIALFVAVAMGSLFVIAVVFMTVYMASHHMKPGTAETLTTDLRFILPVQLSSYLFMIGTMYVIVRYRYGQPFLSAVKWNWSRMQPWVFVGLGIALAIAAELSELVLRIPKDLPIQKYFSTMTGAYLMGVFGVLIAPPVEELFFRGFIYPVVARRMGMLAGIGITGALFALLHGAQLAYSWSALVVMFGVGAALTAMRAVTKSLAASTIAHVTYNFVLMFTLWIGTDFFRHLEQIGR